MNMLTENLKILVKGGSNFHRQGQKPNIFLFSTPRSGSTWLMELIASQKGIKACNEPFNIRKSHIVKTLGISDWKVLANEASLPVLKKYLDDYVAGKLPLAYFDLLPYEKQHQYFTNRIIFKILFAGEDHIDWFQKNFNAPALFLIRHPLPVSLSREQLPRLHSYLNSDYRNNFTEEQIKEAGKIIEKGSKLEQAVLDWCFQNVPPLKKPAKTQLTITYEQLVLDPVPIINKLTEVLSLENKEKCWKGSVSLPGRFPNLMMKPPNF